MIYRNIASEDIKSIKIKHEHSNLLIKYELKDKISISESLLEKNVLTTVQDFYSRIISYSKKNPEFKTTYDPWDITSDDELISSMANASMSAKVGPMAAVAGAVADTILDNLLEHCSSIFVENGGDIALTSETDTKIAIYPGWSKFNNEIILKLNSGRYGIATSSARFGHSFSLGKADMVTVVAENATLADAFATSICNQIKSPDRLDDVISSYPDLISITAIIDDKLAHWGDVEIDFS